MGSHGLILYGTLHATTALGYVWGSALQSYAALLGVINIAAEHERLRESTSQACGEHRAGSHLAPHSMLRTLGECLAALPAQGSIHGIPSARCQTPRNPWPIPRGSYPRFVFIRQGLTS